MPRPQTTTRAGHEWFEEENGLHCSHRAVLRLVCNPASSHDKTRTQVIEIPRERIWSWRSTGEYGIVEWQWVIAAGCMGVATRLHQRSTAERMRDIGRGTVVKHYSARSCGAGWNLQCMVLLHDNPVWYFRLTKRMKKVRRWGVGY